VRSYAYTGPGTISARGDARDSDFFYQFESFLYPGTIFRFDFKTLRATIWEEIKPKGIDTSQFITTQIFYESKDKTKIPMFVTHKKDQKLDGSAPCLLYGYGGFSVSILPSFSMKTLLWVQHTNGIYAVPNLRGGAEYGEDWHVAGTKLKKQNVFDDFIAAAEWLIARGYTSSPRLAIHGGSNGGLLVAACVNQRPELYGAAVAAVGVLDMLRFHRFTIGYAWCSDYGNAEKDAAEFKALYAYSPYHNVCSTKDYPAVLLTTADHDDRVVPAHSFKYMAALQAKNGEKPSQKRPLLIRIESKAGHGAGKPLAKQMDEAADVYAFMIENLGATWRS